MVITAIMIVPRAILYRRMDFHRIARSEVVGSVVGSTTAIALAAAGFGVWALVMQPVVGTGTTMAMNWSASRWMPSRVYSWTAVAPLVGFSVWVLGSMLLHYASRNVDQMLIGRVWGKEQLGFYALAFQLMTIPVQQVASVVAKVLYPALAQVKKEVARIRGAYLRAVKTIGMVTFPMLLGLFAVSDDFVPVVLGQRWVPMRPVLDVFCFSGMAITVGAQVRSIFMSLGRTKTQFLCEAVTVPVALAAYFALVNQGIRGIAFAFLAGHIVTFAVNHRVAFRLVGLSWKAYLEALSKPFLAAAAMAAVLLFAVRPAFVHLELAPMARLAAMIPLGALLYVAFSWIFNRAALLETIDTARGALSRDRIRTEPLNGPGVT
jgi:PST family polysaccharide transporter